MGRIDELDERSDIFSLGGILYAILTLRPPVEAATLQEVLEKVRAGIITPLSVSGSTVNGVRRRAAGEVPEAKQSKLLPHLPGGRVPLALAAVAMKALSLDKANRYSRVGALSADIEAWQGGFATSAEKAGRLKQMRLLMLRHKAVTASLAALLLVSIGFLLKVMASERRAVANEQTAVQEKDSTRRALARAQIALADAAVRDCDGAAARAALRSVPEDLRDTNWDYLIARSDTSLATLRTATTGAISAVAPHPRQAGVFAIAGEDGGIALTNARTGTRLLEFQSNLPGVRGGRYLLSFSSDGAELAVGNLKASVIAFFSARDGGKLREWATPPPFSIEFRPAERQLLVTPQDRTEDKDLRLCDAETGAVVWSFESDSAWFRTAFHPSGQSVVVASGSSRLQLLDASDGHEIRALPDSAQYVHSLAVSPDGELAACGDEQGGVLCVRLKDGQSILRFRPDPSTARQILFTPESHRFVTLSYPDIRSYNQLRVWDASDGYLLQSLLGADDAPLFASIHPLSGELVVTGGTTKSWNISRDEPGWTLPSTVNGPWVSFCGSDDHLLFWDSSSKPQVTRIVADASTTTCWQGGVFLFPTASVSADGRTGLAGNHSAGTFTQIAIDAGGVRELAHWTTSAPLRRFLRLSPDGERVWTGSKMLAAATGREQYSLFPEAGGHLTDGQWISASRVIAAWADGERSILALAGTLTGKTLRTAMHGSRILTIAASPGGKLIAEAGRDKLVRLRDPETLAVRREFRAHDDGITALAFHPLEPVLATASDDLTLRLWNWETGAMLEEIRGLEVSPVSLSWSPGGRRLASAGIDRFVRVWEPRTMNAGSARP